MAHEQSWTTSFHNLLAALFWSQPQADIQVNNGEKYPNTESLATSTPSQAEPEEVTLDIEAGLHFRQATAYVRDNIKPTSSPAAPHSSPISTDSNQRSSPSPQGLNPIAQIFREQELGKTIVGLVMPVAAAFLSPYAPTSSLMRTLVFLSLSVGFAVLWNGILLRNSFPRYAHVMEQIGAALVLIAVY